MKKRHRAKSNRDKFDVLSALWVLACNDPISIMSYNGIRYRLKLPADCDIESLVEERGELFRPGVPSRRLEEWKIAMQLQVSKRPAWIRDLEDEASQLNAIEALSVDDVFRSQFRTEKDAPPSTLEILDWGLQHIERRRKANLEAREEVVKRWQLWSVIILSIVNIAVTLLKK
ncbi:hypothetical protein [Nostoc sp. WHI]|uniref:hypothetical protein n=1 Tax=Nostoc sp. WHI TaxID=2650611 RepID=UPI0018C7C756|nr:hypothetical protein [Nostoc sp. WHI]MBG1270342.1 hypothetical protein [Nostoc sp. WHI]